MSSKNRAHHVLFGKILRGIEMDRTSIPRPCELAYKCLAHASHSPILHEFWLHIFSLPGQTGFVDFSASADISLCFLPPSQQLLRHGLHRQHNKNIPSPTRLLLNTPPIFGWKII